MDLSSIERSIAARDGRVSITALDQLPLDPELDALTRFRREILRQLARQLIDNTDDPEALTAGLQPLAELGAIDRPEFDAFLELARLAKKADLDHCAELLYRFVVNIAEQRSGPMSETWAVVVWERADCLVRIGERDRALKLLLPIAAVTDKIFKDSPAERAKFLAAVYALKTGTDEAVCDAIIDEGRQILDEFVRYELVYGIEGARLRFNLAMNLEDCGHLEECLAIREGLLEEMDAGLSPEGLREYTVSGRDRIRRRLGLE